MPNAAFDPVRQLIDFHAAINRLDYKWIEQAFAEDAAYISAGTGPKVGRDAILVAFRAYFETYPDQIAWNDRVEQVDSHVARSYWNLKATHAQTGQPLERTGVETIEFDHGGRIIKVLVEDR
ncbi:nuclear transport factor 2 family protein [Rhizobium sp. G187]|uniref:nuclear transport factor 2 family protein n=1 Tax=Rhizobium sp. G187 TaxID=3451352 RepID=UPI003EE81BD6